MISAVSFGNSTQQSSWSEKIHQPQAYTVKEEPAAASTLRGKHKKQSAGKKIFKLVAFTAAVAGVLAYIANKGTFKGIPEDATGFVNKAKRYADKAGNWVINTAKKVLPKTKEVAAEAAEQAVNATA